jgi:hypothetical protein
MVAALVVYSLAASRGGAVSAAIVFSDDFNRASGTDLGNGWQSNTLYGTGVGVGQGRGEASIQFNQVQITNNSTFETANSNLYRGRTYIYQDASTTFAAPYSTTLASNPGIVTWAFNIGQDLQQTSPSGFNYVDGGNYGAGVILAAANSNFGGNGSGNFGYAVLWGNNSGNRTVRLVKFSDGIHGSTYADFGTAGGTNLTLGGNYDSGTYLSVRVSFDPSSSTWSLFADPSFGDPTTVTNQLGSSVVDSTYTGTSLPYFGALFNYANGANQGVGNIASFDNFSVNVTAVPEPGSMVYVVMASATVVFRYSWFCEVMAE